MVAAAVLAYFGGPVSTPVILATVGVFAIAIYRNSDSKLIGTYAYDLWGRPVSVKEAAKDIDTDGILTKNPFRYSGYYYDAEIIPEDNLNGITLRCCQNLI